MQQPCEASFWEILVFSHTWRSNIKAETSGTYTGKFLQQFYNSISYFLLFYEHFFLASHFAFGYSQCQSWRIWEKQIYKKQGWILPLSISLPKNPISASAINFQTKHYICKQHINDTSYIQKTTIANNNLSEDPEKTNLGTVKMMEAKCEDIVIM